MVQKHSGVDVTGEIKIGGASGVSGQVVKSQGPGALPAWLTPGSGATIVRKTGDETVNNSDVLQNDDHLLFAMAASEVWEIFCILINISVSSTPKMKIGFSLPVGAILYGRNNRKSIAGVEVVETVEGAAGFTIYAYDVQQCHCFFHAVVINGVNAGNFQLQWAQNTATAENTTMKANSCLIVHKLA